MLSQAIRLTPLEMAIAEFVAHQRLQAALQARADPHKYGFDGDAFEAHYQGCLGEMAFAKGRNLYWSGAGVDFHNEQDVGKIQVRVTSHKDGHLIHRPNEGHLDDPWVLVIGREEIYRLAGWLYGRDCRRDEWLRTPNGRPSAYFVPQDALHPLPLRVG